MNKAIAHILKSNLEGIPIVDKLAGLVQTYEYQDTVYDETGTIPKTFVKKIPVSSDADLANCDKADLVPDDTKKGILYFEDNGTQCFGNAGQYIQYRSKLRMVAWFNTKTIANYEYDVVPIVINYIASRLSQLNATNQGKFLRLKVNIESIPRQGRAIFNEYTYDTYNTQYLLPPYEYFAIDLSVEYVMLPDCKKDLVIGTVDNCGNLTVVDFNNDQSNDFSV